MRTPRVVITEASVCLLPSTNVTMVKCVRQMHAIQSQDASIHLVVRVDVLQLIATTITLVRKMNVRLASLRHAKMIRFVPVRAVTAASVVKMGNVLLLNAS